MPIPFFFLVSHRFLFYIERNAGKMNNRMTREHRKEHLLAAQRKAEQLFHTAEDRGLIIPGKNEKTLNTDMYELAFEMFGIRKYWHKRIVRAGKNTLLPYRENPPDLTIHDDDILFFDFGPVFEEWEADFGRTYVLGSDPQKNKLRDAMVQILL